MDREKRLLALFTLAGILLRLLLLLQYAKHNPFYDHPILDSVVYLDWSQAILENKVFFAQEYHHPPGYAFFLAAIFKITGINYFAVLFFQSLLLALDGVLVFLITRCLSGSVQAWIAFALFSFCGPVVFYSMKILSETLYCSLLLLAFFWLLQFLRTSRQSLALLAGLFLGAAIEVRGNAMICLIPCFLVLAFRVPRGPSLRAIALMIGGVLVFMLPVLTRNVLTAHAWTAAASNWGENFYFANNPDATGTFSPAQGIGTNLQDQIRGVQQEASKRSGRNLTSLEAQRFWFREGLRFVTTQPMDWIRLELQKVQRLFSFREASSMYFFSLETKYFGLPLRTLFVGSSLILILSFAGVAFLPLRVETHLLLGFIVSQVLLLLVFWPELRFLLPLFPFLIPIAAGAVPLPWSFPVMKAQTVIAVAGILICLGLNLIPLHGTGGTEAWYTNASAALFSRGDFGKASVMAERAVQLNPAYENGWVNLGAALFSSGQIAPARQAWQKALNLQKDDPVALRNLALSYEEEDPELALEYWDNCLAAARSRQFPAAELSAIEQQITQLKSNTKPTVPQLP
jgi:tetratricopeptide (TPR) repeat protein